MSYKSIQRNKKLDIDPSFLVNKKKNKKVFHVAVKEFGEDYRQAVSLCGVALWLPSNRNLWQLVKDKPSNMRMCGNCKRIYDKQQAQLARLTKQQQEELESVLF